MNKQKQTNKNDNNNKNAQCAIALFKQPESVFSRNYDGY